MRQTVTELINELFFTIARTMSWLYWVARLTLLANTVLNEHISSNTSGKLVMCDNNGDGYRIVVIAHIYFKQAYNAD